jgi:hypothetical protein
MVVQLSGDYKKPGELTQNGLYLGPTGDDCRDDPTSEKR